MRRWRFWWRTILFSTQYTPSESIEHLMILLMLALGLRWAFQSATPVHWQYLALSSSFALGAAGSIAIREALIPSPRPRFVIVLAVAMLLLYSLYAFSNVAQYA